MDSFTLVACVLLAFLTYWTVLSGRKKKGHRLPPGPFALPLIGNLHQLDPNNPGRTFLNWSRKYGHIFRVKLATSTAVVLNDVKTMKELLHLPASAAHMSSPVMLHYSRGPYGILNSNFPFWQQQRRFTLQTLRDFGYCKTESMTASILEEAGVLLQWLGERIQTPVPVRKLFVAPVVNSLWQLIAGERCNWTTGENCEILEAFIRTRLSTRTLAKNGVFLVPALRFVAPSWVGWNTYVQEADKLRAVFEKQILRHRETFDRNNLRDFIDYYLKEIEGETDPKSSFYKETGHLSLIAVLIELFAAGSETTSFTLSYALLYLSENPQIQRKIQAEIDGKLGEQCPTLADKAKMPYTEATMLEALRLSSSVSLAIPHEMTEDLVFQGYVLPKGTIIMPNIYGIHYDPQNWENPHEFRPERFTKEDGTCWRNHPNLVPFGEGRRKCVGLDLAYDNLFLMLTTLLKEFWVAPEDPTKEVDYEPENDGIISGPKEHNLVFSYRKQKL